MAAKGVMSQPGLDLAQVHAVFQQMRGVRMPQAMYRDVLVHARDGQRRAEDLLHGTQGHRTGGGGAVDAAAADGGK